MSGNFSDLSRGDDCLGHFTIGANQLRRSSETLRLECNGDASFSSAATWRSFGLAVGLAFGSTQVSGRRAETSDERSAKRKRRPWHRQRLARVGGTHIGAPPAPRR